MKRIVLFSGGSACRSLNIALCHHPVSLTRIVPAWDSGGSSRSIRENIDVLSVGDIRQALMTMAYGENCSGDIVRICNTRLSSEGETQEALREFQAYAEDRHPLLERLDTGLRGAIVNYLQIFSTTVGVAFDYRNGSIGNFILTGAYLAHNRDMNTAIFVFRKLCGITGEVWPSSLNNDLVLSANLNDGQHVSPQDRITHISRQQAEIGINSVTLQTSNGSNAQVNTAVLEAIKNADLVAFGPGSFYTSIMPHLQVKGVIAAIAKAGCPVALIANILECRESHGLGLQDVANRFIQQWHDADASIALPELMVLGNQRFLSIEKYVGEFAYLSDEINESTRYTCVLDEFEDVWVRGKHDGEILANRLLSLVEN
ncbi:gluconeogenesis factor YvcK family protein [Serratia ureilytica]|uniref:gluconeogenesis factor YvcK family protein n=1 Tax=Serratia ureilytica TaxID=300181 RepID=UPI0018D77D0A|nr:YvcK family protein [Serratia ureilytica]